MCKISILDQSVKNEIIEKQTLLVKRSSFMVQRSIIQSITRVLLSVCWVLKKIHVSNLIRLLILNSQWQFFLKIALTYILVKFHAIDIKYPKSSDCVLLFLLLTTWLKGPGDSCWGYHFIVKIRSVLLFKISAEKSKNIWIER